ncbi:trypsin-like serine peptidase [Actinomadura roseirufa]|uniref:trypsin-like serine peptidase n=1 Tax=Actinomadura roseirufa TaxID=2094049 RepID=UPI001041723D|nr:hypothetical protein [Actinomadura roseirufa]
MLKGTRTLAWPVAAVLLVLPLSIPDAGAAPRPAAERTWDAAADDPCEASIPRAAAELGKPPSVPARLPARRGHATKSGPHRLIGTPPKGKARHGASATANDSVGLLYGEDNDGKCQFSTASVVISPVGKTVLATAAHSVYIFKGEKPNRRPVGWLHKVFFIPAWQKGKPYPYGKFAGIRGRVEPEWLVNGDYENDLAFVLLKPDARGRQLSDLVTQFGLEFNKPMDQKPRMTLFGYYDLDRLTTCEGPTTFGFPAVKKQIKMRNCLTTEGSSGGPWYADYTVTYGYVNGVTSVVLSNEPSTVYSVYFDDVAYDAYKDLSES